jgi:hypothetical protein
MDGFFGLPTAFMFAGIQRVWYDGHSLQLTQSY